MFSVWLAQHARGTLDDELTATLAELVEAVQDHEKKGELVLKLIIEPAGSGRRTVTVAGKVAAKPPEPAPEMSIFYVGDAGTLHRDDPYAQRLPGMARPADDNGEVHRVPEGDGTVQRVDTETTED